MSTTITIRRSRSGRQVRTTTSARRAVARQSIDRTSSPTTYSRSESNSVPWPRTSTGSRPSISRSRASRDGRCLRDRKAGRMRTVQAIRRDRCRPASPSGPSVRTVVVADRSSPRRTGRSVVCTTVDPCARISSGWLRGSARALGAHASRMRPRNRRPVPLFTCIVRSTVSPRRADVPPDRVSSTPAGLGASRTSASTATANAASSIANDVAGHGDTAIGSRHTSATSAVRPVSTTSVVPARLPGSRRAPRPRWRPRARLPDAARSGAAVSVSPSP